ncbi:family 43 glycosylhydrolase [Gracilibacillus sp. D59]|uniref:family 43 glycosylhydrolase n=1 Tax=Gracilibacillus sp. D59 TaxID=3457434 RepID=UPI003FCE5C16
MKQGLKRITILLMIITLVVSPFPMTDLSNVIAEEMQLEDGLLLHYDFENESGNVIEDKSGNGHDGELINDATLVEDEKGGALSLDGDQDYALLPTNLFDGLEDMTISTWVKIDNHKDWATLYSLGNFDEENNDYAINYAAKTADSENGALELFGPWPFPAVETGSVAEGEWVHVATMIQDQELHHYINGIHQGSVEIDLDAGDIHVAENRFIGYHAMPHEQGEGKGLEGLISDFRMYDRALSLTELRTLADFNFDISEIEAVNINISAGSLPVLPDQVTVHYPNGLTESVTVTWDEINPDDFQTPGEVTVEGTVAGTTMKAIANITVVEDRTIKEIEPVILYTHEGSQPELPEQIQVTYADNEAEQVSVEWGEIPAEQLERAGVHFTVEGTIENTEEIAMAKVYVTSDVAADFISWYSFDETQSDNVFDISGNEQHATLVNDAALIDSDKGGAVDLDGDRDYVQMPTDLFEGTANITISSWVKVDTAKDWASLYALGNWDQGNAINFALKQAGTDEGMLELFRPGQSFYQLTTEPIAENKWAHVATVIKNQQMTHYINGVSQGTVDIDMDARDIEVNANRFIGFHAMAHEQVEGKGLDGQVADFRIYNDGLSENDLQQVINESLTDQEAVERAAATFELGDLSEVITDIELPSSTGNGVEITWESSHSEIINASGEVSRPGQDQQDTVVTLTATFARGDSSQTKSFEANVLADNIETVDEISVITPPHHPPSLPEKVEVTYFDGSTGTRKVDWENINSDALSETQSPYTVNGEVYGTDIPAKAVIHVAELDYVDEVHVETEVGVEPEMPTTVTAHYTNGMSDEIAVDWNDIDPNLYRETGSFTVKGEAATYHYTNPLIEQRADPNIYKHTDGNYYFTASVPEYNRIIMRKAKTIQGLASAEEKVIWEAHESGDQAAHIWAPEIHYVDNKWYIHYAAGASDNVWRIRPYALENTSSDPLEGEWVEKGMIQKSPEDTFSFTDFSLDATIFEHNGNNYYIWAQKVNNISNLYMAEMENGYTIKGEPMLLSTPDYAWERIGFWVNEGPDVIKRNGKIFVSYSASATDDNYKIGLLTADEDSDIMDPSSWTKSPEPVMESNEATGQYGPGHSTFTVAEDGETDILVYHARSYQEIEGDPLYDPNRHTRVKVLNWKDDGTPDFGVPNGDGLVNGPTVEVSATVEVKEATNFKVSQKFSHDQLVANETLTSELVIANQSESDETVTAIITLYNQAKQMVEWKEEPITIKAGEEASTEITLDLPDDVKDHMVKVMIWHGEGIGNTSMQPISEVFSLE